MSEFEGKTISVVTNDKIRYIGVLAKVDGELGTVSLINVRVLGTEDRILDIDLCQSPKSETLPSLQLDGQNVDTLEILDCTVEEVNPIPIPMKVQHVEEKKAGFSFDNSKLEAERVQQQTEGGKDEGEEQPAYNKQRSFFDSLSSSNDKEGGRISWNDEKAMNMDTFGSSGHRSNRGRGGNRGR